MDINEFEDIVIAGASNLHAYNSQRWIGAHTGEMAISFNVAVEGTESSLSSLESIIAQVTYYLYPSDIHWLIYDADPDAPKVDEAETELTITLSNIPPINKSILQRLASQIAGKEVAIIHEERIVSADRSSHEYRIEYHWRIIGGNLMDKDIYRGIFEELEELLIWLTQVKEGGKE